MKINRDYVKKVLEAFETASHPIVSIRELQASGLDYNDQEFVFHMGHFVDLGLIEREDKKPGFGLARAADWSAHWSVMPLRMTAKGYEFLEALRNQEVWATLKRDFKEGSLSTLFDISKQLLKGYLKQKADALIKAACG